MAEIVVGAVISVLVEKLISGLAEKSSDLMKLARSEGIDSQLNKWKKNLLMIQAVLADATQKQITEETLQIWLNKLQDLAYDIEDVLDDLATEALGRKLNQEASTSTSTSTSNVTGKALKFLPNCCTNFTPRNIKFRREMRSKLAKITTRLRDLVHEKNGLGLGLNVNVEKSNITDKRQEETTSLVKEPKIMGREGDKEVLLGKLLGNEEAVEKNVRVVSIVGMGGIGKTTLAQVLYNDEKVINHFEVRAWVCVSEEWDVVNISKAIFQAVTGENKDFANLNLLHEALKEKLSKKRFLLVLDDVWDKDYNKWELLRSPLLDGAPESRVIVTTRNTDVANAMGSQEEERHSLKPLSYEHALSLFALHAIDKTNFDKHPTFKPHGESIVKKCGELPLALKMLGRALNGNKNVVEWKDLSESGIWKDRNEILPALRLSYYHLPLHLKQLFACCSLIPKDYVFDKNKLVLLWMAQGFLSQSNGNMSMERLGHKYFDDLKSRSFFQQSTEGESGYTMHDLINDLATDVAGEFSCRADADAEMDESGINEPFEKFRHFSLIGLQSESCRQLKEVQRAKCLRTFLFMSVHWDVGLLDKVLDELLPELQLLRVLSFMELTPSCYIRWDREMITKVPESIGSLKHLRYLNFSYTGITCLPEEVSKLYNLQSLLVHNCRKLSSLPESFAKLINLRHLDLSDTPELKKMPLGIAGLTGLQTLTKVIVEEANGFKISDLKGLSDLQGRLSITGLEKVIVARQAREANLHQKKGLDVLEMEWSDDSRNANIEDEVLEKLRPPPKIKKLNIQNYKGTRFPSWIGDHSFDQLTELTLCGCRSTQLPTLGHLRSLRLIPSLVKLSISNVKGLTQLVHGEDIMHLRALEHLEIKDCDELRYLWERDSEACKGLVSLQKLEVRNCKKLVSSAAEKEKEVSFGVSMKSLKEVTLDGCDTLESYNCPNTVEELLIEGCDSMTSLTFSAVQQEHPPSSVSESIVDSDCDNIQPQPISRLTSLHITNCKNLKSFPHEHFHSLTALEEMYISDCPSMDNSFPCGMWPPNLRELRIGNLNKRMSEWGVQNFPTSLAYLSLYGQESRVVSFAVAEDVRNTTTPSSSSSSSFLLPPSLVSLELYDFEEVRSFSEVLQHLPSLKRLIISDCPKIRDIKKTSDPSSNLRIKLIY